MKRLITLLAGLAVLTLFAACEPREEIRQLVPFDDWKGGHRISVPAGAWGKGCGGDGQIIGAAVCFDPPVHPTGEITWLSIGGHDVPLTDTRLKDGMLETRDFGAVEIILPRIDRTEMLATPSQIKAITAWIKEQDKLAAKKSETEK